MTFTLIIKNKNKLNNIVDFRPQVGFYNIIDLGNKLAFIK